MAAPANLLSWLVWLPIAAGLAVLLLGDRRIAVGRWVALAATVATFALCLPLWRTFDRTTAALQFLEREPWIGALNAWYYLGVDGVSFRSGGPRRLSRRRALLAELAVEAVEKRFQGELELVDGVVLAQPTFQPLHRGEVVE